MHPTDRAILEHCLSDFRPVVVLKGSIPSGSLYRHLGRLLKVGWLDKHGPLYRATEAGRRQIASATSGTTWDVLTEFYPPLALVPTSAHRAMIELILAAVVARQHQIRPDRHPFFVASGGTLRWKTSSGRFVCYALGLDSATQVVDCGSEAGRSLTFRRGGDGTLVSKRALLESPFLVLDEFQVADRGVRSTLGILLSGRLVTPVENEQLTVRPVPLLTLNPKDAAKLEERFRLSAPLIRRALLANLDAVPMPDLASMGERAVEAAKGHSPLVLGPPRDDLRSFHDQIVDLVRNVLVPDAHERIDVGIVANLAAGMTALIAEPVPAIAQVVHGMGVLAETLGWARPGWIEVVSDFQCGPKKLAPGSSALARVVPSQTPAVNMAKEAEPATVPASLALAVPASARASRPRTSVPDLDLSDQLRARLVWLSVETGQDLEMALTTLLDFYLEWREDDSTIETLAAILRLAEQLELAAVDVETLQAYLKTLEHLRTKNCAFEDVPEALRVIAVLEMLPISWAWADAKLALDVVAVIIEEGLTLAHVGEFLEHHQQLGALGFDEATAAAVADALNRAGATAVRRGAVLDALVEMAGQQVDLDELQDEQQRLKVTIERLRPEEQRLSARMQEDREQLKGLREAAARLNETKDRLQAECDEAAGALAVAEALRAFLMGRTAEAESLWVSLEAILAWRKHGGRVDDAFGRMVTEKVRHGIVEFFQKLLQDMQKQ